jgi:hypothetical protein
MGIDINITLHQIRNIDTCPESTDKIFLTFFFLYNAQLTN